VGAASGAVGAMVVGSGVAGAMVVALDEGAGVGEVLFPVASVGANDTDGAGDTVELPFSVEFAVGVIVGAGDMEGNGVTVGNLDSFPRYSYS
jgi:hypothetical protein